MGDYADDQLEGECCSHCNKYFEESYGYPVLCPECWKDASKKERNGFSESHEQIWIK